MGAILAIIGDREDPELARGLERMINRSPYRGRPERHIEPGLALAVQTRGWDASLATIGNWTVAMHGVIGNWHELAPIHHWDFPDGATSAAKLAIAYEDLGDRLFGKLRGEFAILIFDRRERRIIAVRDLWGKRPLFFESTRDRTYIASEIRQVRAGSQTPNEIDGDVLIQEILWRPTFPCRTTVKGVTRVTAGEIHRLQAGSQPPRIGGPRIWEPPAFHTPPSHYDFHTATEELKAHIDSAVARWMVGVPFAVSMSGGVDSSTVWWTVKNRALAGDPNATLGTTYSKIQPNHRFDESDQIRRILQATQTNGIVVDVSNQNPSRAVFENAEKVDSPFVALLWFDPDSLIELHEQDRQLLLNGDGGDDLLAGSHLYIVDLVRKLRLRTAFRDVHCNQMYAKRGFLRRLLSDPRVLSGARRLKRGMLRRFGKGAPPWIARPRLKTFHELAAYSPPPSPGRKLAQHQIEILENIRSYQNLAKQECFEQLFETHNIAFGSPLSDIDILNFAWRTHPRAFSNGIRYKELLRNVAYNRLGDEIRNWRNPYPKVVFPEQVLRRILQQMPVHQWILASAKVICPDGVNELVSSAVRNDSTGIVGEILAAEAVVRHLTCPSDQTMPE